MKKLALMAMILGLAACSSLTKKDLGLERQSPDESRVEIRSPLSLPPEFHVRPVVSEK